MSDAVSSKCKQSSKRKRYSHFGSLGLPLAFSNTRQPNVSKLERAALQLHYPKEKRLQVKKILEQLSNHDFFRVLSQVCFARKAQEISKPGKIMALRVEKMQRRA